MAKKIPVFTKLEGSLFFRKNPSLKTFWSRLKSVYVLSITQTQNINLLNPRILHVIFIDIQDKIYFQLPNTTAPFALYSVDEKWYPEWRFVTKDWMERGGDCTEVPLQLSPGDTGRITRQSVLRMRFEPCTLDCAAGKLAIT
jgi:hypothetical protein